MDIFRSYSGYPLLSVYNLDTQYKPVSLSNQVKYL